MSPYPKNVVRHWIKRGPPLLRRALTPRASRACLAGLMIGLASCGGGDDGADAALLATDAATPARESNVAVAMQVVDAQVRTKEQAVPPNPLPPGTVTLPVEPNVLTYVRAYTFINPSSCQYIENGAFTILTPPTRGTLTFTNELITYPAPCTGPYPSAVARYTWTDASGTIGDQDFFVLRFTTTSGSASATSNWLATLGTRTVAKIALTGGADITGTTQAAVVGQRIALSGSVASLPAGVSVVAHAWQVAGSTNGGFVASRSGSQVLPTDFGKADTAFHWVAPSSNAPQRQSVTYSAQLSNNTTVSATAAFDLVGPEAATLSASAGVVQVIRKGGVEFLSLGRDDPISESGMRFTAAARAPQGYAGTFVWTQVLAGATVALEGTNDWSCEIGSGLDDTYPYISPSGVPADQAAARPAAWLPRNSTQVRGEYSARMHLMWDPSLPAGCEPPAPPDGQGTCTSMPVPLGYVDWGINAAAGRDSNGAWQASGAGVPLPAVYSIDYPLWSKTAVAVGQRKDVSCLRR